ncbi:MAG: DUF72 domain-containing protein, partial [Nitrospinaceae bacterium]|nr:DUF72 domain-containing protein [Nitrospinaceae bacterium]NIU97249.1 DUF72 domain-containing protein [Nitrospinaceae bacterium]
FDTVEINATFYRTPTEKILDSWNRRMDPSFHLVAKGARTVTHYQRLKSVKKPLKIFLDRVLKLKTLEVILWQLPPGFHKEGNLKRVD